MAQKLSKADQRRPQMQVEHQTRMVMQEQRLETAVQIGRGQARAQSLPDSLAFFDRT